MMEIEVPKLNPSQQETDMIDILWRQDIDLGAGREVFDYSYRQKEHELQRRKQQEEEKQLQRQLEQEKALLAQLQLDEETGEFVPRTVGPARQTQSTGDTPSKNTEFSEDGDAMSFDECMELLAQTFPLVETSETTSACLATSTPPTSSAQLVMVPQQQPLTQNPLLPTTQKTWAPDLDQAWMELLSIPELQQCLNIQMQEMADQNDYLSTSTAALETQDPSYSLFLPHIPEPVVAQPESYPQEFIGSFDVGFTGTGSASAVNQMPLKTPDMVVTGPTDEFCDMFYPDLLSGAKPETVQSCEMSGGCAISENQSNALPFKPLDMRELSATEPFEMDKTEVTAEFPDSDSGLSLDASPNMSSPEKPSSRDDSIDFSDSDLDEMDSSPGSECDYSEMLSLPFDTNNSTNSNNTPFTLAGEGQEQSKKQPKREPAEGRVHSKPPFTKDKARRRAEARLSRDELRARDLQIPFTVDMIINLPVDDFNEMMSKHQLNEAQLALVRDIRRRGKNKVAAQNCRKRKMENIVGLESELDSLKEERDRLLHERTENSSSLRCMKQQLNTLYMEVFGMLRDEQGRPYSPAQYSLQQTSDGNVFLVPRVKKTLIKSDH